MSKAEIVTDSIGPNGVRLITYVLTYPRIIHGELMTHRAFSRNASSSRAIPVSRQITMIEKDPFIPKSFTKNQKGMQGGEPLAGEDHIKAEQVWVKAMKHACEMAREFVTLGVSKQYANRILEPYSYITVVCTATEYENFFALRVHTDAQPEMQEIATKMYEARLLSTPKLLSEGQYHLPFITQDDYNENTAAFARLQGIDYQLLQVKRSVARCARVSYLNHEGKNPSIQEDLDLYDRLVGSDPKHCSPTEHQASASNCANLRSGNLNGWHQYRQMLPNQNIKEFKNETKV